VAGHSVVVTKGPFTTAVPSYTG